MSVPRWLTILAHRFNWHHVVVCQPDGDTLYWCQWCGMRAVMRRANDKPRITSETAQERPIGFYD
jgi:hypothetical protein